MSAARVFILVFLLAIVSQAAAGQSLRDTDVLVMTRPGVISLPEGQVHLLSWGLSSHIHGRFPQGESQLH